MLGFIFGFNARIGRLHYLFATLALAVVMTAISFAIANYAIQHAPRGVRPTFEMMAWPVIAAGFIFCFATFTLQAMRIRDIGWDPVCVIPAWIAIIIVDSVVAGRFPVWSLGVEHRGTIVGALTNLVMFGCMMFWPGGDYIDSTPALDVIRRKPDGPAPGPPTSPVPASRIARATKTEFGRRTV
jgi:uncharacterized membrane protein YhaH (DUF805 family)